MKEENVMKKTIKSALSKGVSAMLNRTLTSGANASSSYFIHQPVEPASLNKKILRWLSLSVFYGMPDFFCHNTNRNRMAFLPH